MTFFSLVAVMAVVAVVSGAPAPNEPVTRHAPSLDGSGWKLRPDAAVDTALHIRLQVAQSNLDTLSAIALSVSDPKSPKYAQYLSQHEVNELTKPSDEDMNTVREWLREHNVAAVENGELGQFEIDLSAVDAERVFGTTVVAVENTETGQRHRMAKDIVLPMNVHLALGGIYGLHALPLPPRAKHVEPVGSKADPGEPYKVTPDVINQAYGISGVKPSRSLENRQAVAEFQGQVMNDSDLVYFFKEYVKDAQPGDDKVFKYYGPHPEGEGIEAQLDIQYIMGVAPGIKTEFWEQLQMDFCSDLKNWTSILLSTTHVPYVHSISYGWQGSLTQIGCKDAEVTDIDTDFQKLAAQGVSLIFASGDSGSGYAPRGCDPENPGTPHTNHTGESLGSIQVPEPECCEIAQVFHHAGWTYNTHTKECTLFKTVTGSHSAPGITASGANIKLYPSWPASSPWVTAVGSTRFIQQTPGNGEMSTDQFGSGGGFSDMFTTATWQKTEVDEYLEIAKSLPPKTSFNIHGRATPDVSALGEGFQVLDRNRPLSVGGTSASAPTFAAIVSLLNEARIQANKKPLGFLNPFIYQNKDAFTDVTEGSNKIGRGGQPLPYGFECAKGWDPSSGVGTPIFSKLLKAALDAPSGN